MKSHMAGELIKSTDLVRMDRCEVQPKQYDKSVVIVLHGPNGSRHEFQPGRWHAWIL
jgi:hypothetical protein